MKIYLLIIIFIFLLIGRSVYSQSKILINEFLIDPQPQSVEIFNSGEENIDISNWVIDDSGGTTFYSIPKDSIIFPNQCLVFFADFNLNKTSADTVNLINNSQQLVDSFSYKSSSGSGISYFRQPDGSDNWTSGPANLGFYNQANISCLVTPSPIQPNLPSITDTPIADLTVSPTPSSYSNVYLSEVMANPISNEKEWVEIYNDNDFPVSLNNWFVDDLEDSGSSPKIFYLEIDAKSYAVFDLSSSIFNNDEDNVRLLDFNKNLKDDFEYKKTETGKTFGRSTFQSDDFCLQEPSKNSANNLCVNPTVTSKPNPPTETGMISMTQSISEVPSHAPVQTINYPTGAVLKDYDKDDVLGVTTTINNDISLVNFLAILSTSYSLLTICSILFRMKITYGRNKNFYS